LKLISKERDGAHVTKQYDRAQTPLQRLLNTNVLDEGRSEEERAIFRALDPIQLLRELNRLQDCFWAFSWNCAAAVKPTEITAAAATRLVHAAEGINSPVEGINSPVEGINSPVEPSSSLPSAQGEVAPIPAPTEPIEKFEVGITLAEATRSAAQFDVSNATGVLARKPRDYRRTHNAARPPAYPVQSATFTEAWAEIDHALHCNPYMSSERLMVVLQKLYPGRFADGQVRTLRRCVRKWRLAHPEYADVTVFGSALARGAGAARAEDKATPDYTVLPRTDITVTASKLYQNIGAATIWEDVIGVLERNPHLSVPALFTGLKEAYPGRYRTLDRGVFGARLKEWRRQHPEYARPPRAQSP
jgi:hypothetical protein